MARARGRFIVLDVHDWDLTPSLGHHALVFRPSGRTIGRQLWVTVLCAAIIGLIMFIFGVPPGSKKVGKQRDRVAQLQRQVEQQQKQAARVRQSVIGSTSPATRAMAENLARRAERARQQLERERAALDGMSATLGPVGDTMYWAGVGVLGLIGIALPISGRYERITLMAGDATLRIRTVFSFVRSRTLQADGYVALAVQAQRLVSTHRRHARVDDHGWLWRVLLLADPDDPHAPPNLELHCDREDILPPRVERLTARTRQVVAFCQQATGLEPQPPITTDVKDVDWTALGRKYRVGSRRHGPVEPERYGRLD